MALLVQDYFSAQVFFIILRETLESAIIVSVLLAFLKQSLIDQMPKSNGGYNAISASSDEEPNTTGLLDQQQQNRESENNLLLFKKLRLQIWLGAIAGLLICSIIGGSFIVIFYLFETDLWAKTEHYWEATLSIFASIIIPIMGLAMLRVNKLQEKWKVKLTNLLIVKNIIDDQEDRVLFGCLIGVILYKCGDSVSLKIFLVASTCFLYLVAAGLFSKGVWQFELQHYIDLCGGQDMSEVGSGPGSYDITHSVWHVNCCNGEIDGGWMIFTAIVGWTNSATYGSVSGYIIWWLLVIALVSSLQYEESHGVLPLIPISWQKKRILKRLKFHKASQRITNTPLAVDDLISMNSTRPLVMS